MDIKLSDLTVWGWLLVLTTIGIIVAAMMPWGQWLQEVLPNSLLSHGAKFFALPVVALGIGFFAVGWLLLNAIGLDVIRE